MRSELIQQFRLILAEIEYFNLIQEERIKRASKLVSNITRLWFEWLKWILILGTLVIIAGADPLINAVKEISYALLIIYILINFLCTLTFEKSRLENEFSFIKKNSIFKILLNLFFIVVYLLSIYILYNLATYVMNLIPQNPDVLINLTDKIIMKFQK